MKDARTAQESFDVMDALTTILDHLPPAGRVLDIGGSLAAWRPAIAAALGSGGWIFVLDDGAAASVSEASVMPADGPRVVRIVADPARYLHKLAGPFDLIAQRGAAPALRARHDRIMRLLRTGGALVTLDGAGYNEVLASDPRVRSSPLAMGAPATISIRQQDQMTS